MSRHPKTLKLARLLGIKRREAVGLLHDLFSWGLEAAEKDGILAGLTAEDIADALDFPRKSAGKAIMALVESGYLDQSENEYSIHNWYDYAGKLYDKRESDAKRKREEREVKKRSKLP